ncbi:hypothetical protein Taro_052331 [Colocasia esculenta]|uniref:Transmembrane protein 184C n=1 Tax=Colocasia esculenta TaxID=4460 RepID=A0A843XI62_COLES|nr:hypothetical protein [Colocasia esculenta]
MPSKVAGLVRVTFEGAGANGLLASYWSNSGDMTPLTLTLVISSPSRQQDGGVRLPLRHRSWPLHPLSWCPPQTRRTPYRPDTLATLCETLLVPPSKQLPRISPAVLQIAFLSRGGSSGISVDEGLGAALMLPAICSASFISLQTTLPGNTMDITKMDPETLTLLGAGCGVMLTMHFTIQLLTQHLFYWKNPKEQKAIIIIVLMAPLYAIDSFVGLLDIDGSKPFFTFLDSVKECYEALVIAKFMALMYSYLNISLSKNLVPGEIKGRELHHSFPMNLFLFETIIYFELQPRKIRLEHHTLRALKYWTWQFVVVRPVCSVLMIVFQLIGFYPSWLSWTFTIILNFSVSLALYALVLFYHVFAKELAPHKPLAKFMCIKGIVFFCFWQGVALEVLAAIGVIKSNHFWLDVEHIQEAIQNVLVIFEMVIFSVLQQYAYHVAPYSGDMKAKFEKKTQ